MDHNYGEPVHRATRNRNQTLSRHQRRPDQLDQRRSTEDDSEDNVPLVRATTSRRVLRSSQEERHSESDDSDDDNTPLSMTMGSSARNKRKHQTNENGNDRATSKINQNQSKRRRVLQSSEDDSGVSE
jgi:hypothetical protein